MTSELERNEIELILISGFLGAGKTTCLQELIDRHRDRKMGLIINEFGKISIDGMTLEGQGAEMLEINNGSIFCSCLKGSFIEGLIRFSKLPIDLLIVECSGLADPSDIGSILIALGDRVSRKFVLSHSICVVDGHLFKKQAAVLTAIPKQIKSANLVLINKEDLADAEILQGIISEIGCINPQARIVPTTQCRLDRQLPVLSGEMPPLDIETENTPNSRLGSVVMNIPERVSRRELEAFLQAAAAECHRIKGYVYTKSGWLKVDVVSDQMELKAEEKVQSCSRLVLISKSGNPNIRLVKMLWAQNTAAKMGLSL